MFINFKLFFAHDFRTHFYAVGYFGLTQIFIYLFIFYVQLASSYIPIFLYTCCRSQLLCSYINPIFVGIFFSRSYHVLTLFEGGIVFVDFSSFCPGGVVLLLPVVLTLTIALHLKDRRKSTNNTNKQTKQAQFL